MPALLVVEHLDVVEELCLGYRVCLSPSSKVMVENQLFIAALSPVLDAVSREFVLVRGRDGGEKPTPNWLGAGRSGDLDTWDRSNHVREGGPFDALPRGPTQAVSAAAP